MPCGRASAVTDWPPCASAAARAWPWSWNASSRVRQIRALPDKSGAILALMVSGGVSGSLRPSSSTPDIPRLQMDDEASKSLRERLDALLRRAREISAEIERRVEEVTTEDATSSPAPTQARKAAATPEHLEAAQEAIEVAAEAVAVSAEA